VPRTSPPKWPDNVAIIGGGRWARVLAEVLCGVVPAGVGISVHSARNAASMSRWAAERDLGARLRVSNEWPRAAGGTSTAVLVVNAARDHERAVEWALRAGLPVMVEKPIARTAAGAAHLAQRASELGVRFAAAHIFLFARYVDNFARRVAEAGEVRAVLVRWTDPRSELRYGEPKRYDAALPVFADWLPHVVAILGALSGDGPTHCKAVALQEGGAQMALDALCGGAAWRIELARDADERRRVIEVDAGGKTLRLDFSREPGTIAHGAVSTTADPLWDAEPRPAARMLSAFLGWAAGGEFDGRLSVDIGIRAARLIDDVRPHYRRALGSWLGARLASPVEPPDPAVRYCLTELLQSDGDLPADALEGGMARVHGQFLGPARAQLLETLAQTEDPGAFIRGLSTTGGSSRSAYR
jgi:predicted dehydrogenase